MHNNSRHRFPWVFAVCAVCVLALAAAAVPAADQSPAATAANASPLVAVSTRVSVLSDQDAPLYRVILHNTGTTALPIQYLAVPNADGTSRCVSVDDPEVLWWRAVPPVLEPGAFGEVRIKAHHAGVNLAAARIQSGTTVFCAVALPRQPSPLVVVSVKCDPREDYLCLYWRHTSPTEESLDHVVLDGRLIPEAIDPSGRVANQNEVRCFTVHLKNKLPVGSIHHLWIETATGLNQDVVFRVAPGFHWGIENTKEGLFASPNYITDYQSVLQTNPDLHTVWPDSCMAATCLTHLPGKPQHNAWLALRTERNLWQRNTTILPAIHLCRQDLADGVALFGQIADQVWINPYALPVQDYARRDWLAPMKLIQNARRANGVGSVGVVIPVDKVDDDRILARTLVAIAAGCSAVTYRLPQHMSEDETRRMRIALETRLKPLKDSLPVWDAAEVLERVGLNDGGFQGYLMQMGPRRMAVILVSSYEANVAKDITLKMNLPPGLAAQRILALDGSEVATLKGNEKAFAFTLKQFQDAGAYFIELVKPEGIENEF